MNNSDKQLSFQNFFLSLLNELSKREQEVLKKRYQLSADVPAKNTLKQIGDVYGITRERVRQIEKEAIGKLVIQSKADNYQSQINEFEKALKNFLAQKGGVVSENDLIENHISQVYHFDELHVNSFLFTIENLIKGVERNNENQDYYSFWHVSEIEQELIEKIVNDIASVLTTRKTVVSEADLHSLIENEVVAELQHVHLANLAEQTGKSLLDFAKSYIEVTKKVEKNILNTWGLAEWPDVRPKKLSDKIHLVFTKVEKPLHFRDVAEMINTSNFDKKTICAATVHNELIANEGYVLIGRGIYAKKDWGYTPGTVTDIIVRILNDESRPMSKDEIYQEVLKQRQVNPSTIYLSLINKDKFNKVEGGLFELNK